MAEVTVTTEQVQELIQQLAAMNVAASITPQIVANIFEKMRNLNDQEREKVIAVANEKIREIIAESEYTYKQIENLQSSVGRVLSDFRWIEGSYISSIGTVMTLADMRRSEPVKVFEGDIVAASGDGTGISGISVFDGENYTNKGTLTSQGVTWIADADCYVVISGRCNRESGNVEGSITTNTKFASKQTENTAALGAEGYGLTTKLDVFGNRLKPSDGSLIADSRFLVTRYVKIESPNITVYHGYTQSSGTDQTAYLIIYDSSFNKTHQWRLGADKDITIDLTQYMSDSYYIRVAMYIEELENCYIKQGDNVTWRLNNALKQTINANEQDKSQAPSSKAVCDFVMNNLLRIEDDVTHIKGRSISEFTWNEGYYITYDGRKVSSEDMCYSEPIQVFEGDIITVSGAGTGIGAISVYNGSTYDVKATLNNNTVTWTADEDCEVTISGRCNRDSGNVEGNVTTPTTTIQKTDIIQDVSQYSSSEVKIPSSKAVSALVTPIKDEADKTKDITGIVDTFTWVEGYYINQGGAVIQTANMCYSQPVSVIKNTLIYVKGAGTGIGAISVYNEGSYSVKKILNNNTVTWIADKDCQVVVSGRCNRDSGNIVAAIIPNSAQVAYSIAMESYAMANQQDILHFRLKADGTLVADTNFLVTKLVKITDASLTIYHGYTRTGSSDFNCMLCTYDENLNKTHHWTMGNPTAKITTVNLASYMSDSYYIRVAMYIEELENCYIQMGDDKVWSATNGGGGDINFSDTEVLYNDAEWKPKMANLKYSSLIGGSGGSPTTDYTPLSLLHYSDIHNNARDQRKIFEFADLYSDYIDDILLTGDIAGANWNQYSEDLYSHPMYSGVLKVIGNHDIYKYNNTEDDATAAQCYDRYFAGISGWGVVEPDNNNVNKYCYYYKDYIDANVRLIVLDCMHYTNHQLTWFTSVLADAKTNSLAVLVTQHIPTASFATGVTPFATPFNSMDYQALDNRGADYVSAVKDFLDAGGEFVCWLFGHQHTDYCGVLNADNRQIYISIGIAGVGNWADTSRIAGTKSAILVNMYSIDTFAKTISILRVGADRDRWNRYRGSLILNYSTRSIVYTT